MPDFNTYAPFSDDPYGDPEAGLATHDFNVNYGTHVVCQLAALTKLILSNSNVLGCLHHPNVLLLALFAPYKRCIRPDVFDHLPRSGMCLCCVLPCVRGRDEQGS